MAAESSRFADRFLQRLRRIDPDQIEGFIAQMLREKGLVEEVLDLMEEGVVLCDRQGRVLVVNRTAGQILGLRRAEAVGKALRRTLRAEAFLHIVEEFDEHREPIRDREVTLLAPRQRTYAVSIAPLEEEGQPQHSVLLIRDRTEQDRRAEERQTIGRMEAMAALTAGVAHEVKNPLNSLNIHAQIIRTGIDRLRSVEGTEKHLEMMERSTEVLREEIQRLASIVDDFTRAVKPVRPQARPNNINSVIESVAALLGPACAERNTELVLRLDSEIPLFPFDHDQIQQALLNVLKNALEAIDKEAGRIEVRTDLKSDHVLIEIEDNGCGIRESDRLKIFEPYHTTKFEGTGLGLMVVYRIIRAHRGAVGLRSEVGQGTCFSIALPLDERPVRLLGAEVAPPALEG